MPSVISTLPSGLNLTTMWPRLSPFGVRFMATASVTQTLPSLSTSRPCGQMNMPPPMLFTTLPSGANLTNRIGFRVAALIAEPLRVFEALAAHDGPDVTAIGIGDRLADRSHGPTVRQLRPSLFDAIGIAIRLRGHRTGRRQRRDEKHEASDRREPEAIPHVCTSSCDAGSCTRSRSQRRRDYTPCRDAVRACGRGGAPTRRMSRTSWRAAGFATTCHRPFVGSARAA